MKEQTFHTIHIRLNGLLEIYKEAYPSATVARTYENSIYQNLKSEINTVVNILSDEVNGRGPVRAQDEEPRPPDAPPFQTRRGLNISGVSFENLYVNPQAPNGSDDE